MEAIIAAVSSTTMIDSIIRRRLRMPGIAPASFGQQLAEQTAGCKTLRIGSFIADDALTAELYASFMPVRTASAMASVFPVPLQYTTAVFFIIKIPFLLSQFVNFLYRNGELLKA